MSLCLLMYSSTDKGCVVYWLCFSHSRVRRSYSACVTSTSFSGMIFMAMSSSHSWGVSVARLSEPSRLTLGRLRALSHYELVSGVLFPNTIIGCCLRLPSHLTSANEPELNRPYSDSFRRIGVHYIFVLTKWNVRRI